MSSNTQPILTGLDFDDLKQSLKNFLQSQSQFQDFNFEGAGLNVLLDVLAYNTHLMAYYLNMVANEMFLDTAILRSSTVSQAKALGYTPRSAVASQATVNCAITRANNDSTGIVVLPRFTQFTSSSVDGTNFTFLTLDTTSQPVQGNTFNFNNLLLKEGTPVVKSFVQANNSNPTQTFDLVDTGIDTSTLQVIVQNSSQDIRQTVFQLSTDATTVVTNTSPVFFINETANGSYQIYFGQGVIGKALTDGNIVVVSYVITDADRANFLSKFNLVTNPLNGATSNVTTVTASAGGTPIESVASVQFNAPKSYVAQNRAVTSNDYETLINKNYPFFDAVNVWGGETVNPPVFGVVFISVKPKQGFVVTETQKQFLITNVIKPISVLTVTPRFVDPDYNFIILDLAVQYDSKQTTNPAGSIDALITGAVNNYANTNLNTFNSEFRISRLLRTIDDSETSILSSAATIWLEKRLVPTLNANTTYTLNVGIPIHRGTVNDLLYSTPSFNINDAGGVSRLAFFEEVPESFSGIEFVTISNPGSGYLTPPKLIITGDGTGANAYPIIVNGKVAQVVVDKQGANYTTATVVAVGGAGSGAAFTPSLIAKTGTLRTYYFDTNHNKIILNANAGTIDYIDGTIVLNSFSPTAVNNPQSQLSIIFQPDTQWLVSNNERILTIDQTDPNAINIDLTDINNL